MSSIRLILGDQLSESISSLEGYNSDTDIILMCEIWNEATYVKNHKKKIAFLFSAMRYFAVMLKKQVFNVEYTTLDNLDNAESFNCEVKRMISKFKVDRIIVTHPGEYRVLEDIRSLENELNIAIKIREDDRFLCSPDEFDSWASDRKQLRMEYFYREMRKKYDILMEARAFLILSEGRGPSPYQARTPCAAAL